MADVGLWKKALSRYRAYGMKGLGRALNWRLAARVWVARRALGGRLVGPVPPPDPTPMKGVLDWLSARDQFTIVQIGAYVGDTPNDPLYAFLRSALPGRSGRRAILVEPIGEYFDALQKTYGDISNIRLENVAIAEEEGQRELYRLAPGIDPTEHGYDEWVAQTASFRPDRWERHEGHPGVKEFSQQHRTVERVQCWTFDQLLQRHQVKEVDLLQVDAEGYDYEILRTIDFSRIHPRFINYERILLHEDEPACRSMLMDAGYVLFDWDLDTLGIATG
jgi:FkbM family methyltransferase